MNFQIPDFPEFHYGSIYCIGKNYAEHIREMNSKPDKNPVVFLKPRSSIIHSGGTVHLPESSANVHHEAELVLLIGATAKNLSSSSALSAVKGIAVGIDFTARDLQSEAKKNGKPWALSKGFDTFAPVGNFAEFSDDIDLNDLNIELRVNETIRQNDNTRLMLFPVADIISYLSRQFTLSAGDLIFTGTPKGVSSVKTGDEVTAILGNGISEVQVHVQ